MENAFFLLLKIKSHMNIGKLQIAGCAFSLLISSTVGLRLAYTYHAVLDGSMREIHGWQVVPAIPNLFGIILLSLTVVWTVFAWRSSCDINSFSRRMSYLNCMLFFVFIYIYASILFPEIRVIINKISPLRTGYLQK
jgi:hypothetical protein